MKCYKYTCNTPMFGSVYCEALGEPDSRREIESENMLALYGRFSSEIDEFLKNNVEDLSEHICDSLKGVVVKAIFGEYDSDARDESIYFTTHIYTRRRLTAQEEVELQQWIEGQMSDGWGESLEQMECATETVYVKTTSFDPYLCEFEEDECTVDACYHIHPWSSYGFSFGDGGVEEVELDIEEEYETPVIHSSTCTVQGNGEYKVRTVYTFMDIESVVKCFRDIQADEMFVRWLDEHGSFGCAIKYYIVYEAQGMSSRVYPVLGINDMDLHIARLYTMNTETGEVEMETFVDAKIDDFHNKLLNE